MCVMYAAMYVSLLWLVMLQVHEMKSARDSGELQVDTLKDEIDQLRTWKDKVANILCI